MFGKFCFIVTVLLILTGMTACGTGKTETTIPTVEIIATLPDSTETKGTTPIAPTDDEEPVTSPTEEPIKVPSNPPAEDTPAIEPTEPTEETQPEKPTTPPSSEKVEEPTVESHTHSYIKKTIAATCEKAGEIVYTCACGDDYTEVIPALEHDMEMSYTAPTTEAEGVEVATCKRCGYEVRQILEKLPVLATNADASEIEALVIQYINEYRAQEGACAATWMEDCDAYTQYRSAQMAAKGKVDHNTADIRAAATAVQYGVYTDPSEYGIPGDPYYAIKGREAVGMDGGGTIDYVAKTLATGFFNSKSHWSYVGDDAHGFISVGVTEKDGRWYCCVVVALVNLDDNPAGI